MSDRRTVMIVCAKAPHPCVPAVRRETRIDLDGTCTSIYECSRCGARVKVVA